MQYISKEMLDFLAGIRANNHKEWFEAHKDIYLKSVYEPLKALGAALFASYADMPDMLYKVSRIYKDANYAPYLHYRDTMYIYIRHEAEWWSRTPTLFFEVSPDGAQFGFRIASPTPAFMAYFRKMLEEDASGFLELIAELEASGIALTGDEYKRPKPCPDESLLPYFKKKSLTAQISLSPEELLSGDLPEIQETFAAVFPLYQYLYDLMTEFESGKVTETVQPEPEEPSMVQAPKEAFMW